MKQLEKISLAVVIGAALATAAVAQSRPQQNHNNRPAPPRQTRQAPTQPVRVNNSVQRTMNFPTQNRTQTLQNHTVDTGMNNFRRQVATGVSDNRGQGTVQATHARANQGLNRDASSNQTFNRNDNGNQSNYVRKGSGFGQGNQHQQFNGTHLGDGSQNLNDNKGNRGNDNQNRNDNKGDRGNGNVQHFGDHGGNWRQGYDERDNRGSQFHFSFYLSAPTVPCVPSPWYDYSAVPAYLQESSVTVLNPSYVNWDEGNFYTSGNYLLTRAVTMISSAFQTGNTINVPQLVEANGQVNVYNDGQYEYSLSGNDFGQMMEDNAASTQTVSFAVTSVRTDGAYATVDAAHTFTDPGGNTQTVYQEYRLEKVGGSYYITDFSTSDSPL